MDQGRCAACRFLRRRCPTTCIFAPYFPPNNPRRFVCVHKIFGAKNAAKTLQHLPTHLRADAAESMFTEAESRIQDPVYGCVGTISLLLQQIQSLESELAQTQAQITFLKSNAHDTLTNQIGTTEMNIDDLLQDYDNAHATSNMSQGASLL